MLVRCRVKVEILRQLVQHLSGWCHILGASVQTSMFLGPTCFEQYRRISLIQTPLSWERFSIPFELELMRLSCTCLATSYFVNSALFGANFISLGQLTLEPFFFIFSFDLVM